MARHRRRRAGQLGGASPRHDPQRLLAQGLVDHLAVQHHRPTASVGLRLLQRGDDAARTLNLLSCGREGGVERVQLTRMDRPLAVVSERASVCRPRLQASGVADPQMRAVDRLQPGGPGRHQHRLLREAPAVRRLQIVGWPAERRSQIGIAEDQSLQARTGLPDVAGPAQPRRRLDQSLQADRPGAGADRVEQPRHPRDVLGCLHLRDHERRHSTGRRAICQRHDVAMTPRRVQAIDANGNRLPIQLPGGEGADHGSPCLVLGGRRHRVLQIDHDLVRRQAGRLGQHPPGGAGDR